MKGNPNVKAVKMKAERGSKSLLHQKGVPKNMQKAAKGIFNKFAGKR